MTPLVDSHCHLGHIERQTQAVLDEAAQAGVELVIDIGMGLDGSRAALERAQSFSQVRAGVGIHPNDLEDFIADPDGAMDNLGELATAPGVVAVGETGIDLYRERSSPDAQIAAFRAHIELAKLTDRTLVVHCRDAHRAVLDALDEQVPPRRVVMHCFSGDVAVVRECAERGYFCSFAGNITYKRSDDLREAASVVPRELLLVETDAPFLAPIPHRGKPNAPALVVHTARALADTRSMPYDELLQVLFENTCRAFVI